MTTFLFGILIARGTNENIDLGHKPIVIWPKKPKPKVELSVSEKTSFFQNGRVSIKYIFWACPIAQFYVHCKQSLLNTERRGPVYPYRWLTSSYSI